MPPLHLSALAAQARTRVRRATRRSDLDWLRGVMLVLMTVTHLPTWFSAHFGQPVGFVSAAEGFVFLSAFLVGSVYTRTAQKAGIDAMQRAVWMRTLTVYGAHVALLLFLFYVLVPFAATRGAHAITNLATFYTLDPGAALVGGLLLVYNPPLLDILPMYVVFLALTPWMLQHALRHGWSALFAVSIALWLFAQVDGGRYVYETLAGILDLPGAYSQTGAFALFAWQLLWLVGLYAGAGIAAQAAAAPQRSRWPRVLVRAALAAAIGFFVWRHVVGQAPFGGDAALNLLFDKWRLGPLRLLNFAVLAVVAVDARDVLMAWARRSSLATLGRASLAVFSAHVVLCLTLLAFVGDASAATFGLLDAALLAGTLITLYAVARIALARDAAAKGKDGENANAAVAGPAAPPAISSGTAR